MGSASLAKRGSHQALTSRFGRYNKRLASASREYFLVSLKKATAHRRRPTRRSLRCDDDEDKLRLRAAPHELDDRTPDTSLLYPKLPVEFIYDGFVP